MPARKTPEDWKERTIAVLRAAARCGSVIRGAHAVGERRPQLIEDARRLAERLEIESMTASPASDPYRYNKACALAADALEGKPVERPVSNPAASPPTSADAPPHERDGVQASHPNTQAPSRSGRTQGAA
ncbi:MAG TPA: hypothetical protein VIV58_09620 [Kofleriaceae bacterium]